MANDNTSQSAAAEQYRGSPAQSDLWTSDCAKLLRLPTVLERLGHISRAALYARLDSRSKHFDPELPRPVNFFPGGRAVFWVESELDAYIERRIASVRAGGRP